MKIGFSTGYREEYWSGWPFTGGMYGGSEKIVVEVAAAMARKGHDVTVRLPRHCGVQEWRGVRWVGLDEPTTRYDSLYCFDDFERQDVGGVVSLVACRSDQPKHTDFDRLVFLSAHHAALMGFPGFSHVGGGVDLEAFSVPEKRLPSRVICTSSPDRCPAAPMIGAAFDFVQSYRPVRGVGQEMSPEALRSLQKTAKVHIYPLDPIRPSDFFSMAVLESMAAGTPVVVSDADSMPELWSDAAIMLPLPIDLGEWYETVGSLLVDRKRWKWHSERGQKLAQRYGWETVADKYLEVAR